MTGDGVNDAPALRQAEVGIAVSTACDVAREAASIALTNPGLMDIVAAVETSREIYERMLTCILNKIIKTIEVAVFLTIGLYSAGNFLLTPFLGVLLLLTNDFITMSLASDRVRIPVRCRRWPIRSVVMAAGIFAACLLALSYTIFWLGAHWLRLDTRHLQTLVFAWLAFSGQGMVYVVRERRRTPGPRPGFWLLTELPLCSVASDCSRTLRLFRSAYMAHLGGRAKRGSRSSFWSSALMSAGILEKNPIKGRPFGASRIKRIA
ncbi:membrane protein of unknown function [Methylacidimicrobium sp. AP8]|nr:membrane protein of unknown function [Methylacidimicrobium sp. AP8]